MLDCRNIFKRFDGMAALDGVDLQLNPGEIVGLIGPNGSGKTTMVNVISGFYKPDQGKVSLDGTEISGHPPHRLRRAGIARTFQNVRLYDRLPVIDNVLIGLHPHFLDRNGLALTGWIRILMGLPGAQRRERTARSLALDALHRAGIAEYAHFKVGDLSYGLKKRLELARVVALMPKVLLLDEPTAGLTPEEANRILHQLQAIVRERPVAVLIIEHRLDWLLGIASRIMVLEAGRKIAEGSPEEIRRDPSVIKAYIGG